MNQPAKFRKRPVVIEAMQLAADNIEQAAEWIAENDGECGAVTAGARPHIYIDTLEGMMTGYVGDWIICGVKGEFYPCKPDIFDVTYEPDTP